MKITRVVPTTPAMMAVGTLLDGAPINDPFFDVMREREMITSPSTTTDQAREDLADLPDCPAATTWRETMEATLALTDADTVRPYDRVEFDTDTEQQALRDIDSLADALRETSPLLDPVADMLDRAPSLWASHDLGDLTAWVAAVTGDALTTDLPRDGYCDKHEEYCYDSHPQRSASWEHIEAIAPGTRQKVADLVAALTADLPEIGEYDNGVARDPRPATTPADPTTVPERKERSA